MRTILDPVDPAELRPLFQDVFRCLQRGKALESFVYLGGHYLLSLDGTTYFSSTKVHCSSCLEKHHRGCAMTYSHQSALVHVPATSEYRHAFVQPWLSSPKRKLTTVAKSENCFRQACRKDTTQRRLF